jgi:hypothetical protein
MSLIKYFGLHYSGEISYLGDFASPPDAKSSGIDNILDIGSLQDVKRWLIQTCCIYNHFHKNGIQSFFYNTKTGGFNFSEEEGAGFKDGGKYFFEKSEKSIQLAYRSLCSLANPLSWEKGGE